MRSLSFSRFIFTTILLLIVWTLMSGVMELGRWDEWSIGLAMSALIAAFTSTMLIQGSAKDILSPQKWIRAIAYIPFYTHAEIKSHIDVIKRILNPAMPINPGIVSVPYEVETDFGITTVACSITNTPGTVTIDVDENRKRFYVHWIDVTSPDETVCYQQIAEAFDKRLRRIFG